MSSSLRIAFIHPDLGIGGAERLVVDTALRLSQLGHHVHIFTSSHNPCRAFPETLDGSLNIHLLGNSFFPRSFANRFISICAILRQLHLSIHLLISFLIPHSLPASRQPFDIYFVDQLSASIPLLRYASRTRVLFYCHFPDLLLSTTPHSQSHTWLSKLKSIYRIPLNWIEQVTTGNADTILVNSLFTAQVFKQTFPSIKKVPKCVYPGVDINRYTLSQKSSQSLKFPIHSTRPTILSINRFEEKKDLNLLLSAYIKLREQMQDGMKKQDLPRLVFLGGYDSRLMDNVTTLETLESQVPKEYQQIRISGQAETHSSSTLQEQDSVDVLFILNGSEEVKLQLLNADSTKLLAYTASNEHLGIGPLEGMACGLPVLAVDSGGPKETVQDGITGFLAPSDPHVWAQLLLKILNFDQNQRLLFANAGRLRVSNHFSTSVMVNNIQSAIFDTLHPHHLPDIYNPFPLFLFFFSIVLPAFFIYFFFS